MQSGVVTVQLGTLLHGNREPHLPDALHKLNPATESDVMHCYVFKCGAHILGALQLVHQVCVACRGVSQPVE